MTVSNNKVVTIVYSVTDETGEVVDSNEGFEPLEYLHGYNNILPGFESAVDGMRVDEERTVKLEPEQAYGQYDPRLVSQVDRGLFGSQADQLQTGQVIESAEGKEFTVTDISDDTITLNGNHPLAGRNTEFKVKVLAIRNATDEELQQGTSPLNNNNVCGPGCCC